MEMGSFHDYADVPNGDDRVQGNTGTERENRLAVIRERIASGYYDRPKVKEKLADILTIRPEITGTAGTVPTADTDDVNTMPGTTGQADNR